MSSNKLTLNLLTRVGTRLFRQDGGEESRGGVGERLTLFGLGQTSSVAMKIDYHTRTLSHYFCLPPTFGPHAGTLRCVCVSISWSQPPPLPGRRRDLEKGGSSESFFLLPPLCVWYRHVTLTCWAATSQ